MQSTEEQSEKGALCEVHKRSCPCSKYLIQTEGLEKLHLKNDCPILVTPVEKPDSCTEPLFRVQSVKSGCIEATDAIQNLALNNSDLVLNELNQEQDVILQGLKNEVHSTVESNSNGIGEFSRFIFCQQDLYAFIFCVVALLFGNICESKLRRSFLSFKKCNLLTLSGTF